MSHPSDQLASGLALGTAESLGCLSDTRVLVLNSYKNYVYQVDIENSEPLIAKFYRPDRWNDAAVREEHVFSAELAECEVPVMVLLSCDSEGLSAFAGFRFALFPRRGERAPEPGNLGQLYRPDQLLGRPHTVSATRSFEYREALAVDNFGHTSLATLLGDNFIPKSLLPAYESVARDLLKHLDALFAEVPYQPVRLHGDCHPGNLLCHDEICHMVDLDDCRMGPALQDLWMMLAGERHEHLAQIAELIDGYNEFHDLDPRQLPLLEGLCSLRLMRYGAWLTRRWDNPALPPSFPWFGSERYWGEQVLVLREQLTASDGEPLRLS